MMCWLVTGSLRLRLVGHDPHGVQAEVQLKQRLRGTASESGATPARGVFTADLFAVSPGLASRQTLWRLAQRRRRRRGKLKLGGGPPPASFRMM
jgi:hypothetical protein